MSDGGASERSSATDSKSDVGSVNDAASEASGLHGLQDSGEADSLDISDLVDQQRNIQDAVYATLHTLTKKTGGEPSWRWIGLVVLITGLQLFLLVFNPMEGWAINQDLWIYKVCYWVLYRSLMMQQSYDTYVTFMYVLGVLVLSCLALTGWVAVVLKKEESGNGWMHKLLVVLQWMAYLLFNLFWVANLDYLVFMFGCSWSKVSEGGAHHLWYTNYNCLALPHVAHMLFAGFLVLVFTAATFCMCLANCELNLLSKHLLATSMPLVQFKILVGQAALVVASAVTGFPEAASVAVLLCSLWVAWLVLSQLPYNYHVMNYIWGSLWTGLVYLNCLLVALVYLDDGLDGGYLEAQRSRMTLAALCGMVPALALGAGLALASTRWSRRPLEVIAAAQQLQVTDLRSVYRFSSTQQVVFLATVVRKWDVDGVPDAEACALSMYVLGCGLARFPTDPYLLGVHAAMVMEVDKDAQAARVQLQAAAKAKPNLIDCYFIFSGNEMLKRLKSSGDGMDLLGYVEFQRNYLVLERYPNSGKLLKVYGRYMEYVRNDPWSASRYYAEAMKLGTGESLMELMKGQSSTILPLMGQVDEAKDALLIVNAHGAIMMVSKATCQLFGYGKGELEGKNISCLMPQPFSGAHNSYMQRYITSGQPHILDSKRQVVALTKGRNLFPVDIAVTKLSGSGTESVFLGVLRPAADEDPTLVRLWVTPQGTILCADARFKEWFGTSGESLVGKACHSLGQHPEAITRLLTEAHDLHAEHQDLGDCRLHTTLLHAFLPPVDVTITLQQGGTEEHPVFVLNIRCLVNNTHLLVTSPAGAIMYVTSSFARLLGYTATALSALHLRNVMASPWGELHNGWIKRGYTNALHAPCLSGGVVDLLASNGARLPVTLKCSMHNVEDQVTLVFQVACVAEEARLDQKRLLLSLDANGTIRSIDSALTPRTLFGFPPEQLLGQQLSSCVQQAAEWVGEGHGGELELLLLMVQAGPRGAAGAASTGWSSSWRVGVLTPAHTERATAVSSAAATLLATLNRRNKVRPGVMRVRFLVEQQEELLQLAGGEAPVIQLELWRADALSSVVELDARQHITRADEAFCLLTGHAPEEVLQQPLTKLLQLPPAEGDLLGGTAKKGLMKVAGAQVHQLQLSTARHKDHGPLQLTGQLVKVPGRLQESLLRLHLEEPSCSTLGPLLALQAQLHPRTGAGAPAAPPPAAAAAQQQLEELPPVEEDSSMGRVGGSVMRGGGGSGGVDSNARDEGEEEEEEEEEEAGHRRYEEVATMGGESRASLDLHDHLQSRLRVSSWLKQQAGPEDIAEEEEEASDGGSGGGGYPHHGEATAVVKVHPMSPKHPGAAAAKLVKEDWGEEPPLDPVETPAPTSQAEEDTLSAGDSAGGGEQQEQELVADFRRAKRLKKLGRLLKGAAAQSSTLRFHTHTYLVLLTSLVVHVACFIALAMSVTNRYEDANMVNVMGTATDRFLRIFVRNKVMQRCLDTDLYAKNQFCTEARLRKYQELLYTELTDARVSHQGLLLGFDSLRTFADPRLLDYWLHYQLPEANYQDSTVSGLDVYTNSTNTVWEIGNRVFNYGYDVYFLWPTLRSALNKTSAWQYVELNSPVGMFQGYAWTLDTFVDYTWWGFTQLGTILLVLLVVEALILQPACIGYAYFLLARCQRQRMKRFSSFLGVPSAALRVMATRVVQVDDDIASEADEDEMEMMAMNRGTDKDKDKDKERAKDQDGSGGGAKEERASKKSVRMAKDVPSDDEADAPRSRSRTPRHTSKERRSSSRNRHTAPVEADPNTGLGRLRKWVKERVLAPLSSDLKVNGHKLFGNRRVVAVFMGPLLLWLLAVVVVFGVSIMEIGNLQQPLMSLDAAAHVLYALARARAWANLYALAATPADMATYRAALAAEVNVLEEHYRTLLYGGRVKMVAPVSIDPTIPPAAFYSKEMATHFFTTSECLRQDPSGCFTKDSIYYAITHQGLDAMVIRFIDSMRRFAASPDGMINPDNENFMFIYQVVANDLTDGLSHAIHMLGEHAIAEISSIKQQHLVLLIVSLVGVVAFVLLVFRPYTTQLHQETKLCAGLLSQLPPEVDVEGQVKLAVLGVTRDPLASPGGKPGPTTPGSLYPGFPVTGVPGSGMGNGWPYGSPQGLPTAMVPYGSQGDYGGPPPYSGPPPHGGPPSYGSPPPYGGPGQAPSAPWGAATSPGVRRFTEVYPKG